MLVIPVGDRFVCCCYWN